MIMYEFKCVCGNQWDEWKNNSSDPAICKCGEAGVRLLSSPSIIQRKTHPDVHQDMHELIAGEPASNLTEI